MIYFRDIIDFIMCHGDDQVKDFISKITFLDIGSDIKAMKFGEAVIDVITIIHIISMEMVLDKVIFDNSVVIIINFNYSIYVNSIHLVSMHIKNIVDIKQTH